MTTQEISTMLRNAQKELNADFAYVREVADAANLVNDFAFGEDDEELTRAVNTIYVKVFAKLEALKASK